MDFVLFLIGKLAPICHGLFVLFIMLTMIVVPCYILFMPDWRQYDLEFKYKELVKRKPYIRYIILIVGLTEYLYIMLALYLSLR